MKDRSIMDMAERLLQREITQEEMDRLSAAPTIADVNLICNDILTRAKRLSESDFAEDYERARRMMLILPKDDINLIIDVIEGRRVEAFVKGFLPGGYEIRPVSSMPAFVQDMVAAGVDVELIKEAFSRAITGHPPDTYRSQGSPKIEAEVSKSVEWITTFGHHGRMFVGDGNFKYLYLDPSPGGVNDPQPYRDYLKRIKKLEKAENGGFE